MSKYQLGDIVTVDCDCHCGEGDTDDYVPGLTEWKVTYAPDEDCTLYAVEIDRYMDHEHEEQCLTLIRPAVPPFPTEMPKGVEGYE